MCPCMRESLLLQSSSVKVKYHLMIVVGAFVAVPYVFAYMQGVEASNSNTHFESSILL